MGVFIMSVLTAFFIVQLISGAILRFEDGSPAKDKDILEFLEKTDREYTRITSTWTGNLYIYGTTHPRIIRNPKWFLYYPYTIGGVGAVPRWYKSRKVIDAKFAELFKGSQYDTNKRKKLGLD
jgi:hypothetical protein